MFTRIVFFFAVLSSATAHSQDPDTLVFATYRYADNNRVKNIEPFAVFFGKTVNVPVKVKSYNSVHELVSAMKKGETDIVFINTFGYLLLREQSNNYSIAAALRIPENVRSTYQTAIVSSTSSQITSLNDLASRPGQYAMLFVNPGSTSGNLIPRLKLSEVGISEPERFFTSVNYTKNHALTLAQIMDGKADIGAFGSEEYHRLLAKDPSLNKKVNLVWESSPIPLGPVLFDKKLPEAISSELQKILLTLHEKNVNALESVKSGWTEAIPADRFQKVDESYYDTILQGNREDGIRIVKQFAQ